MHRVPSPPLLARRVVQGLRWRLARLATVHWPAAAPEASQADATRARLWADLQPAPDGVELACVVLSYRDQPGLPDAVRSMLEQDERVEVVVVNSGGGDPARSLGSMADAVRVIDRAEPLNVGAARNLGIAATRAPFIAFLAADCIAEPGWARGRLREHRAGALAVSSAVTSATPRNVFATTGHLLLYSDRLPGTPAARCAHFGVSYARTLLEHIGAFREDLPSWEDVDLNLRVRRLVSPVWAPDVRSTHRNPTGLLALLADQHARGARTARSLDSLSGTRHELNVAAHAWVRLAHFYSLAWQAIDPRERWRLLATALLAPVATAAYSAGALRPAVAGGARPRHRTGAAARPPRVLALLQCRDEMRFLPGYLENVGAQVDGIIALDDGSVDGSAELLAAHPAVLELLRNPPRAAREWDEPRNRRRLIETAMRHAPDWLVAVDADERLERGFRVRARREIARAACVGHLAYWVTLRELWNGPDTYRVDGIWGNKRRARFFKARPDAALDERALHGQWAPADSFREGTSPMADVVIYHLRMIDPRDRAERQTRYQRLDPERRWQAIGYEYLTDETGLRLSRVSRRRRYW